MSGDIFLIGPMATGKSVVGRKLAARLGLAFIDTDSEITRRHGSIADIFAAGGEPAFRALESAALQAAADRPGAAVVATGGGAVLAAGNRELLRSGFTVYLETDLDSVRGRISGTGRPLLEGDPLARWVEIFTARVGHYRECATVTVDARTGTVAELAETIVDAYRRRASTTGGITT
ncbi:shikimate kinase [Arthrobacter sp. JSM 101049]|uniref:shikimate kinase n=1 Tax=Arthrobacter sp. JSM 101049 TaxID=929097 RepID=UPI0035686DDD